MILHRSDHGRHRAKECYHTHHCTSVVQVLPHIMSRVRLGIISERRVISLFFATKTKKVKSVAPETAWNVALRSLD